MDGWGGVEGGGEGEGEGEKEEKMRERLFHFDYCAGQCNIQYENKALRYGALGFLECPSSVPGPARWWSSTEQCDSFIDYSSQCAGPSCPVFANSSYFYYCCTAPTVNDVLSARDGERSCFRIQSW